MVALHEGDYPHKMNNEAKKISYFINRPGHQVSFSAVLDYYDQHFWINKPMFDNALCILGFRSIARDASSHPRRLDPTIVVITLSFVLNLQRGLNGGFLSVWVKWLNEYRVIGQWVSTYRPLLHYTGLHRSVAIFIPDWAVVSCCLHYATVIRYTRSKNHSALLVVWKVIRYVPYWEMPSVINKSGTLWCNKPVLLAPKLNSLEFYF